MRWTCTVHASLDIRITHSSFLFLSLVYLGALGPYQYYTYLPTAVVSLCYSKEILRCVCVHMMRACARVRVRVRACVRGGGRATDHTSTSRIVNSHKATSPICAHAFIMSLYPIFWPLPEPKHYRPLAIGEEWPPYIRSPSAKLDGWADTGDRVVRLQCAC